MKYLLSLSILLFLSFPTFSQVKPSLENTGTTGMLVPYEGNTTITENGTILENFRIDGSVTIKANNVTIKNCLIETEGFYGIRANFDHTSLLIEDCEIRGMKSAAILGNNFIARRCKIWDSGADGIKPGENFLIEGCYFYNLGYLEDAHADGIQMVAGGKGVIRGNTFDMPFNTPGYKNSQCIIILTNNAPIDDIKIQNNWIDGGGYSVQVRDKENGHGIPTNVSITNNLFGRNYQFGTHVLDSGVIWSCNVWEDTNELIGECDITLSTQDYSTTSGLVLSPNPASNKLHITTPESKIGHLMIYTTHGTKIHESTLKNTETTVDVHDWPNGVYFLLLENDKTTALSKVIIRR